MGLGGVVKKVHENRRLEPELSGFGFLSDLGFRVSDFGLNP